MHVIIFARMHSCFFAAVHRQILSILIYESTNRYIDRSVDSCINFMKINVKYIKYFITI